MKESLSVFKSDMENLTKFLIDLSRPKFIPFWVLRSYLLVLLQILANSIIKE